MHGMSSRWADTNFSLYESTIKKKKKKNTSLKKVPFGEF